MFEEVLAKNAKNSLALLGKTGVLKNAYLAGGTALALRIGHRVSYDFDFFTQKKFDEKIVVRTLEKLPVKFKLLRIAENTILGSVDKTKFSLFFYDYMLLEKQQLFLGINIAGLKDIAAMKLVAVSDRGTKRDFIDLYFLIGVEKMFSLEDIFDFYEKKFKLIKQNRIHLLKSLIYFNDAEEDPMSEMLKAVSWRKVKLFFETEVKKIMSQET